MSLQSHLRIKDEESWKKNLENFMGYARTGTEILIQLSSDLKRPATQTYEKLQREGRKLFDGTESTLSHTKKYINSGEELFRMIDKIMPELRKLANRPDFPKHLQRVKQGLQEAVRKLPEIKDKMRSLGNDLIRYKEAEEKEISRAKSAKLMGVASSKNDTSVIYLAVDNKEIKPDFSNNLGKKQWTANSSGERPNFNLLLRGPAGMPVTVEFKHDYDKNFKWELSGNEAAKLEDSQKCCKLEENKTGVWQLILPEKHNGEVTLTFSTAGFSSRHNFKVKFGGSKELHFSYEIEYTAFRFIHIPYNGANCLGYGDRNPCWGLPKLKTFIDKFAKMHFDATKKKPYIGNKGIQDGVKFKPHRGKSHAGGYGVDIDFGRDTGNHVVTAEKYDRKAHKEQIKRYLDCGATLVYTADRDIVNELGGIVQYDADHDDHDHVNV